MLSETAFAQLTASQATNRIAIWPLVRVPEVPYTYDSLLACTADGLSASPPNPDFTLRQAIRNFMVTMSGSVTFQHEGDAGQTYLIVGILLTAHRLNKRSIAYSILAEPIDLTFGNEVTVPFTVTAIAGESA